MEQRFDLVIIGAGPGGYTAAIEAAKNGLHTAVIEKERLGGTCLNEGCIPTKTILHSAEVYWQAKNGAEIGVMASDISLDIKKVYERKDDVIRGLREGIGTLMAQCGIEVFHDIAYIADKHKVLLKNAGLYLETKYILIAAGTKPALPKIKGIDSQSVFTSERLLEEPQENMKRLLIIGGGIVGIEFAFMYSAMGSEVIVLEKEKQILHAMGSDIGRSLKNILKKRGVEIITGAEVMEIVEHDTDNAKDVACVYREKGQEKSIQADAVLAATGRQTDIGILFEKGVMPEVDDGYIYVNQYFQTCVPEIYAVGDVTGGTMLAHAAAAQSVCAVNAMLGKPLPIAVQVIPSCVYTVPEAASVGITQEDAEKKKIEVTVSKYAMSGNGKSVLYGYDRGFVKVVADKVTRRILGAQMVSYRASDMISQFTQAIVNELTLEDMGKTVFPHPTFSESIGEAVCMKRRFW